MAKVQNTFLKSKMNKDLDARIVPNGEYRDAQNAQISKSENSEVGNLENILGNAAVESLQQTAGVSNLKCIGVVTDEVNSVAYLFLTDYTDINPNSPTHNPLANNFIISYNVLSSASTVLVKGSFLNFSTTNPFYGLNVLENLLFFTDNRNQPRVINTSLANTENNTAPTFYTTEDQISVAKYNPYACMELFQKSTLATGYETTMKDVNSKFLPNGGLGLATGTGAAGTSSIALNAGSIIGNIPSFTNYNAQFQIGYIDASNGNITKITNSAGTLAYINAASYVNDIWTVTIASATGPAPVFPTIPSGVEYKIVFNPNPYYDFAFPGDPDYLEDKFVRFSYRFKFIDNEYSIFSPFTQSAFIPKQDGYFRYLNEIGLKKVDDQSEAYRSTIVAFMENKVNEIKLAIPLPFTNYTLRNGLKVSEIDILYKESDALAVKVVETVPISTVEKSAGVCKVDGLQGPISVGGNINIKDVRGGVLVGNTLTGPGIPENSLITSFVPTDPSSPLSGVIQIDKPITEIANNSPLTIGDPNYYVYSYNSTKPTKTLPDSELVRVYDKVPVKSFAQEVAGNRVIYANFQNKLTPPSSLDYNVACTAKSDFELNEVNATYVGSAINGTAITGIVFNKLVDPPLGFFAGMIISSNTFGVNIPPGTIVTSTTSNGQTGQSSSADITLSNSVIIPAGTTIFSFLPGGNVENTTSKIEYPNSSVKTNRNYQVGFVLSDRYGRQSSVILSNNTDVLTAGNPPTSYSGSTLYSPYLDEGDLTATWPGNSLKVLVNKPILTNLYNGDVTSSSYNPGGWYSYKIVVKQTEQEFYNVYLPGIMAAYPQDQVLELGSTSYFPLINDNINKIPKDLSEVGPDQRQFRSSVQLFGRVENTDTFILYSGGRATNIGLSNKQYFPLNNSDTVSTISTLDDLFDYNPSEPDFPNNFPQFYSFESNPFVAKISTNSQIGQISTTNYKVAGATVLQGDPAATNPPVPVDDVSNTIRVSALSIESNITGSSTPVTPDLLIGMLVSGEGIPNETYVSTVNFDTAVSTTTGSFTITSKDAQTEVDVQLARGTKLTFTDTDGENSVPKFTIKTPGLQYLAVYETKPVESLLDIFWETSSAGLISDLNGAIINNQEEVGAIGIDNWNDTAFTEALGDGQTAADNYILSGNGFSLVNSFGTVIPFVANQDTLDLIDVTITNPTDGTTQSVINPLGVDDLDYFRLIDTNDGGTPGPWNIRTTSAVEDSDVPVLNRYYDNVYHFPNNPNSSTNYRRNFNFVFEANVGGQITSDIQIQANLRNINPKVQNIIPDPSNGGAEQPGDGSITIPLERSTRAVAVIRATNGADNPNLQNGGIPGEGSFTSQNLTFTILSQTIATTNEQALLDDNPIFSLSGTFVLFTATPSNPNPSPFLQCVLINDQYQQPTLGAKLYKVVVRVSDGDGGGFVDEEFLIDMRLRIPRDRIRNIATRLKGNNYIEFPIPLNPTTGQPNVLGTISRWENVDLNSKWISSSMVIFDLTDSSTIPGLAADEEGWYIYAAGFFANNTAQSIGSATGRRGGTNLLTYSGNESVTNPNIPVIIPKNSPDQNGHQVQEAVLFGDIRPEKEAYVKWKFIHVKGQATIESVTRVTQNPNSTLVGYDVVYQAGTLTGDVDIYAMGWPRDTIAGANVPAPSVINDDRYFVLSHDPQTRTIRFNDFPGTSWNGVTLRLFKGVLKPNENPWYYVSKSVVQDGVTYALNSNAINSAILMSPWTGATFRSVKSNIGANQPGGGSADCATPNWCAPVTGGDESIPGNLPGGACQFSGPTAESTKQNNELFHRGVYGGVPTDPESENVDFEII